MRVLAIAGEELGVHLEGAREVEAADVEHRVDGHLGLGRADNLRTIVRRCGEGVRGCERVWRGFIRRGEIWGDDTPAQNC